MSDCIGPINIIPDNNQVILLDNNKSITVIDNNCCTNVEVTQPITSVVQVLTGPAGVQGPIGPQGDSIFSFISGSTYGTTSSIEITGSLTVSGSNTFRNIGPAQFTGSLDITGSGTLNGYDLLTSNDTGSLLLSSSFNSFTASYYADSASFDTRILDNSSSISLLSSSFIQFSGSYNTGSFTGSFSGSLLGTASYALQALSSSHAETASYVNPLNQNVIITGSLLVTQSHISTIDYIDFNTNATPTFLTGRVHWTDDTKTIQIDTDVNGFEIEVGHQNVVRGRNVTGYPLLKGMIVYINGESGNRPTFTTASWTGDPTSASTLGFVAQNINDNQTGYVVTNGILRGLNTNAFAPGTQLYLSSSGQYTSTVPVSPNHEVRLGKTITQATDGYIYVDIMNGYELGELHDVLITSASTGDLISWSSSSRVWINSKQLTGSYGLTGSLNFLNGGITGSLYGTASWANNSSTASYVLNAVSASYSSTASYVNTLNQDVLITGSLTVLQGATIYGSSSFTYVTASQLAVSASTISVNVFEPVQRFGGLVIYDSGSSNATASFLWDSLHNHFVYQNVSGAAYAGGMFLAGPRNTGSLGDEPNLAIYYIPRSDGGDHLENSQIYSSASIHIVTGSLTVTEGVSGSFSGSGADLSNIPASAIVGLNLSQITSGSFSASISSDGLLVNNRVVAPSFSGSFSGSGANLFDIPASGIVGLNLSQIASGSATASISPNNGLVVNTNTTITGSLTVITGSVVKLQVTNAGTKIGSATTDINTVTGSLGVAGTTRLSGSFNTAVSGSILTVIGSGSTQPIFTVQGSQGELFSVTDALSGSLFSVNDISGLPIVEVFSNNTTLIGSYLAPALYTTNKITQTNSGSFVVYSLPTSSYDGAFFDYTVKSGSNARAGQIMAIWSGSSVNFTETTTTDFGSTTAISFTVVVTGSNFALTGSSTTGSWTIKTIVRSI